MMNLAKMEKEKTSIYILIKDWFDWCKHNRDKNNPTLSALYFWIIEKCNSLGWVNSFGLPTDEAMHILGIGSYNTYKKNLLLLQEIGFINIIEFSKNQYTSNVIGLSKFDKAGSKHLTKQMQSTSEALDKAGSKQIEYNNTINTIKTINTNKDKNSITHFDNASVFSFNQFWEAYGKKKDKFKAEKIYNKLSEQDRGKIKNTIATYLQSTPNIQFRKFPCTYLNSRSWEDEIEETPKHHTPQTYDEIGYA
jgi:hypothetical protein